MQLSIEYFTERDSTVNICSIDLAKAFDKLNRYALFIKLMKRKCPLNLIDILENWYSKSKTCVKWGNSFSQFFKLKAGVRQGGVLSPILFAVLINDVLIKLQDSSLGGHIKNIAFNCFMYADDLLLLSISIHDMQRMVDICKSELDWLDMNINVTKTSCIRIGNRFDCNVADITIDNVSINWVNEIRYLGVYILCNKIFKCNTHNAKMKYFRSLNGVLGKIGTSSSIDVTLSLISSFCTPVLLYGLDTGCLSKAQINRLNYPFSSVFTKLFSTFNKNIIIQCQYYTGYLPLKYILDLRFLNFVTGLNNAMHSPAYILFKMFGEKELLSVANVYNINLTDSCRLRKIKIWNSFKNECELCL